MAPDRHITRKVEINKAEALSFNASSLIMRLNRLYNKLYLFNNVLSYVMFGQWSLTEP